jgi:hypothetical protein
MSKAGHWLARLRSCSLKIPSDPEYESEVEREDVDVLLDTLLLVAEPEEKEPMPGLSKPPA